jgi:hypothetical protein
MRDSVTLPSRLNLEGFFLHLNCPRVKAAIDHPNRSWPCDHAPLQTPIARDYPPRLARHAWLLINVLVLFFPSFFFCNNPASWINHEFPVSLDLQAVQFPVREQSNG